MVKTINIGGRDVSFKASAAIPRLYRIRFKRDIMRDMTEIQKAVDGGESIPVKMLECFENLAYLMARHADPENVPDSVEDWLDGFETFSIYEILPELTELWADNLRTVETPKKK